MLVNSGLGPDIAGSVSDHYDESIPMSNDDLNDGTVYATTYGEGVDISLCDEIYSAALIPCCVRVMPGSG